MKKIIILVVILFVCPWNELKASTNTLFEGMYTITGKGYDDQHQYDSPTSCQAIYIKVYEKVLITTVSVYGTADYQDIEYQFERVDQNGNRIYRKDNTDAIIVDPEHNLKKVISTYTYNGNKRTDTCWEVVEGDYSEDCLKRMKEALERERMKTIMDF